MELSELKNPRGARRPRKRKGRGPASGQGKTAGRGEKGQKSRSGSKIRVGFEGGQMPLIRRMPKGGFTPPCRRRYAVVNLETLNRFPDGSEITPEVLLEEKIIRKLEDGVKILGKGTLTPRLVVWAHRFSRKALEAIAAAGGSCHHITVARKK